MSSQRTASSSRTDDSSVFVDCYVIGTLEGVVQRFGNRPEITATISNGGDATFDVMWT